jgi:hypothetical protein
MTLLSSIEKIHKTTAIIFLFEHYAWFFQVEINLYDMVPTKSRRRK